MKSNGKRVGVLALSTFAAALYMGTAYANDDYGFGFDRGYGWGNISIKGMWACSQVIHYPTGDETDYFTHTFNADNTDIFSDTALNSQTSTFLGAQGVYGTVVHGRWKYVGFNKVQRRATFLINRKLNALTTPPTPAGIEPNIAGAPDARALVDCMCTLTDSNTMKVTGTFSIYAPDNLSFTGAPLGTVPFDATCKRIRFSDGS